MDRPFLLRHLTHTVDVYPFTGLSTDGYNIKEHEFYNRVPCLVDEASGRRETTSNTGDVVAYNYAVTLTNKVPVEIGWFLEDARDEEGTLIFSKGEIQDIRVYRVPGQGVRGYLVFVNKRD